MQIIQNRRQFLAGAAAAGAAGLIGTSTPAWAEPPPETTSVRLPRWINGAYCWAGLYLAGELLQARSGFTDVRYVQGDTSVDQAVWIARGETDFSVNYVPIHVASIDAGVPIKVLTGLHAGCLELIANDKRRNASRTSRASGWACMILESTSHVMVALMAAYVGLDPVNDIEWVIEKGNAGGRLRRRKVSMHSSSRRPRRRSCAPGKSATRSSTRRSTAPGPSISAA